MKLLLILLSALAAAACLLLRAVVRGAGKRRLLAHAHGIGCSLSEEFGISVLCSGIDAPEQVDALLASEYTRLEVLLVLDAAAWPEEFARLTARYRMIRVEWSGSQEFPQAGIRTLWRSRRRSCRRLVLIDRPQEVPELPRRRFRIRSADLAVQRADWRAAAAVAAYDYLLPLAGAVSLLPDAVTRLVAELGEHPAGSIRLVQAPVGVPVTLLARDLLLGAGDFGRLRLLRVPLRRRLLLWEPLAAPFGVARSGRRHRPEVWLLPAAFAATGAATAAGCRGLAALCATLALVHAALLCARRAVVRASGRRCTALREKP